MEEANQQKYNCKYCGKKVHKVDYEINRGYCGRCREIVEWKKTLDDVKDYEK